MLLGGTVAGSWTTPEEWEALLVKSRFRAVTAPFDCHTPRDDVRRFMDICLRNDVAVAEVGVWKNPFDPNPAEANRAMDYARGQLADGAYAYDGETDKYTLNEAQELYARFYEIYDRFSAWLTRYQL